MYVAQIHKIALLDSAKDNLSFAAYTEAEGWLAKLSCRGNFKAVVAESKEDAVELCRTMIRDELVPSWLAAKGVKPEHFKFAIAGDTVDDRKGYRTFWACALNTAQMAYYNVAS